MSKARSEPTRVYQLDGIRFIAACCVLLSHSTHSNDMSNFWIWPLGQAAGVGLALFFTLSGFVLHTVYHDAIQESGGVSKYGLARFARLYPLYVGLLLYNLWHSGLFSVIVGGDRDFDKASLFAFSLTQSWWYGIIGQRDLNAQFVLPSVQGAWSISSEIALYLFFPWICQRLGALRTFRSAALVCAALIAGYFIYCVLIVKNVDHIASVYQAVFGGVIYPETAQAQKYNFYSWLWIVSPFTRVWQFVFGAILAQMVILRPVTDGSKGSLPWTGIVAASLFAFHVANDLVVQPNPRLFLGPLADCHYMLTDAMYTLLGGCLIYAAVKLPWSATSRMLASRPMVMGGDATYASYLLHPLFFQYLEIYGFALGMPSALDLVGLMRISHLLIAYISIIGIGYAVYWTYENPMRRLITRYVDRRATVFLLALQLLMFATGVALCTADQRRAMATAAF